MRIDIRASLRHPLDDADFVTRAIWATLARPVAAATKAMGIGPRMFELLAFVLAVATAIFWWHAWQGAGLLTALLAFIAYAVGADDEREGSGTRLVILFLTSLCWMAWVDGLGEDGRGLETMFAVTLLATLIGAQILRRALQFRFRQRYGFDLHRWQGVDRAAVLILASPAIDWLILLACWLFAKPATGIQLVALWTVVSLVWDALRVAMANDRRRRGRPVGQGPFG